MEEETFTVDIEKETQAILMSENFAEWNKTFNDRHNIDISEASISSEPDDIDQTEGVESRIWIDPDSSPLVFNCYDTPKSEYMSNSELINYPPAEEFAKQLFGDIGEMHPQNRTGELLFSFSQSSPTEYDEFDCEVFLSPLSEETNNNEKEPKATTQLEDKSSNTNTGKGQLSEFLAKETPNHVGNH